MRLVYFARVREVVGLDCEDRQLPDDVRNIGECIDWLSSLSGNYATAFADRSKLRFALDQQMVGLETSLTGTSELAIFPPVTGG